MGMTKGCGPVPDAKNAARPVQDPDASASARPIATKKPARPFTSYRKLSGGGR